MDAAYIGALDIGGTKMAASIANAGGPLAKVSEPTVKEGAPDAVARQAIRLLEAACRKAGIDPLDLQTVGVCSAGPFVMVDGMTSVSTPNICGGLSRDTAHHPVLPNDWTVIPLESILRDRFSRVAIENDCVAALMAERTFGAVQDEPDCIYATWSTGIGFGLCVDGRILRGKHGNAGHAGHVLMSRESQAVCGCGNRGDLEAMISGRNLELACGKPTARLFAAAQAGEEDARGFVTDAAQWFGRALYNLAATLDTQVFVIGGSVWAHHGDWLKPIVEHEIASRLTALTAGVRVVPAALGGMVADIGAFSMVMPQEWIAEWRRTAPWRAIAGGS